MNTDFSQAAAFRQAAIDAVRHKETRVEPGSLYDRPRPLAIVRTQNLHEQASGQA